jgi:hypothetical protein
LALEPITQHVELGLLSLTDCYWGKPRIGAWLASYLREVQTLEDLFWEILDARELSNANLARLTVIGKLIGQARHGFDLEDFRTVIRARAIANRSDGTGPALGRVLVALLGAGNFDFYFTGPACMTVVISDETTEEAVRMVREVLPFARAAGLQINLVYTLDAAAEAFTWDTVPTGSGTPTWSVESL